MEDEQLPLSQFLVTISYGLMLSMALAWMHVGGSRLHRTIRRIVQRRNAKSGGNGSEAVPQQSILGSVLIDLIMIRANALQAHP